MTVKKGDNIKVNYTLKLDTGEIVNKTQKPFEFIVNPDNVIKGFYEAVLGMELNEAKQIKIQPEDAYGLRNEELVQEVPIGPFRKSQGKDPIPNMMITLKSKEGKKIIARVVSLDKEKDTMKMDLNHIMAGQVLNFNITLLEIN